MVQMLDSIPGDVAGWAAVIAGLAVFAALVARDDRRRRVREAVRVAAMLTPVQQPVSSWSKHRESAARDVARAHGLAAMQAQAAQQIDAVEHAYSRMLAQCATIIDLGVAAQPPEPAVAPAREPATPAAQPLAA